MKENNQRKLIRIIMSVVLTVLVVFSSVPNNVCADEEELAITVQPENVEVEYPQGASFHVEVNHPENVASYAWELSDGYTVFPLSGESAQSDTLVIPYSEQTQPVYYLCCIITDKNGKKIFTEDATMTVTNGEVDKKVLYVGDYAVEPGQVLDLSTTTLGKGTVAYDADGIHITATDISFSNEVMTFDRQLASQGFYLFARHAEEPEFFIDFKGDCVFENVFYDPDYNSAGIVLNSYFGNGTGNNPTVVIGGDGKLVLKGGSNAIYSDGSVEIAADLETYPLEMIYHDSITGFNILIDEGVRCALHPNGTALRAKGDLRIFNGAKVDIESLAPHVSVGPTVKYIVNADGGIYLQGAELNIRGNAKPELFVPYGSYLVNFTGIGLNGLGSLNMDASKVDIALSCEEGEELYALNFCGIVGGENSSSLELANGSEVKIDIQVPNVFGATGILVPGDVNADKGSAIDIRILSQGEVAGIEADRAIGFEDAKVSSDISSTDGSGSYGIVTSKIDITLNEKDVYVYSKAENGIAMAADTGERGEGFAPEEKYDPSFIAINGKAECLVPEKSVINVFGVPGYGDTIKAETFFDGNDMSAPASEVRIGIRENNTALYLGVGAAVLAVLGYVFLKKKK